VFVQLPVFIGLFHVLRGFQEAYPYNYVFNRADILSFLDADILGVRLSDSIAGGQAALGHISFSAMQFNPSAIAVCLPLMIISSVATHFTARVSQQHQSAASAANPQAAMMGKLTMWLFPIGILIFGAFFPVAILLYWLSNNSWTLTQQYLVYKKIAQEEEARRQEAREHRDTLGPKVGQKPIRGDAAGSTEPVDEPQDAVVADAPADEPQDAPADGEADSRGGAGGRSPGKVNGSPGGPRGSGSRSPGKVGGGQPKNGQAQSGQAKGRQNQAAQTGKGGGQAKNGKGGQPGKKKGQLASSGRPGKRKK
jgi:YidC/Oxa1 family membrane protein insertase